MFPFWAMSFVLVTGGAGYIGSHVVAALLREGKRVIVIDSFLNSDESVIDALLNLAIGDDQLISYKVDLMDFEATLEVFSNHQIECVVHCAGLKAVGESWRDPLLYYEVNLLTTINLLKCMQLCSVNSLVYSSSATVYGNPQSGQLIDENYTQLNPTSPYGRTKLMNERIIMDCVKAGTLKTACILRYFNPVGADPSGLIGEAPRGIPNNLMPNICLAAYKQLTDGNNFQSTIKLKVYGGDYETLDGTAVRDYIHVADLAIGHLRAIEYTNTNAPGCHVFNLGTGSGYTVLQVINAFQRASGVELDYEIVERRQGDVPVLVADATKARKLLGFTPVRGLNEMCRDQWSWFMNHAKTDNV